MDISTARPDDRSDGRSMSLYHPSTALRARSYLYLSIVSGEVTAATRFHNGYLDYPHSISQFPNSERSEGTQFQN